MGIVDFEKVLGVEGVAVCNTVENEERVEAGQAKELKTRITFDDGELSFLFRESVLSCYVHLEAQMFRFPFFRWKVELDQGTFDGQRGEESQV